MNYFDSFNEEEEITLTVETENNLDQQNNKKGVVGN